MKWDADFATENRKAIHLLGSLLAKSLGLTIRAIAAQAWIFLINMGPFNNYVNFFHQPNHP